ncbi:STAS domain-containing protein [Fodinicola acaciae]|uniref:STAS domain-containing protein n=1 Tax=Fodinicola acaciae TaxID=2681555 RepID=UPI0013D09556|nr:STAS domain-containing protein [Fodinicola acaciae]
MRRHSLGSYAQTADRGHARFRLDVVSDDVLAVSGELDVSNRELFERAVEDTGPRGRAGRLVVDATGVTFMDHRCLISLADHAVMQGATLVLRTRWPGVERMLEALRLPNVRVEGPA